VLVGVRVFVDVRVLVGVRVACTVMAAVEDECTIGWGTNAQPIATTTHDIKNQPRTRFNKIDLNPILPAPQAGNSRLTPGRDFT
jgi:hypothetical protein